MVVNDIKTLDAERLVLLLCFAMKNLLTKGPEMIPDDVGLNKIMKSERYEYEINY